MKFKSNANFNKEPKTGSIITLKDNSLGISIHKYAGCGDDTRSALAMITNMSVILADICYYLSTA